MKEVKYNIDKFEINNKNEIEIVGWVVCQEPYNLELTINDTKSYILQVENVTRADVVQSIEGAPIKSGFKNKILVGEVALKKATIKIIKQKEEKLLVTKNNEELKSIRLIYNIDKIQELKGNIWITGWVFSTYEQKVEVRCTNIEDVSIEYVKRYDVEQGYPDIKMNKPGFNIKGKRSGRKIKIEYISKDKIVSQVININEHKLRQLRQAFTKVLKSINRVTLMKGIKVLRKEGIKKFLQKLKEKAHRVEVADISYMDWLGNHIPSPDELEEQSNEKFQFMPKISIVVPTYNTPKKFLIEMIESVEKQTYMNWELCVADGSTKREDIQKVLDEYALKDNRIKVKYLINNGGISENTNAALEMATGRYIGLFDHDDLLAPNALYEVIKALNKDRKIDVIYTDEDKIDEYSKIYFDPHFKQDWAPDTFRSYNYICHFLVFKKSLLEEVGNFRKAFDGSQDYDMLLRLTEKAKKIEHISKILYHWRAHQNSTAQKLEAKDYVVDAGERALEEHLKRIELQGTVEMGLKEGTYRITYAIQGNPKVSIIIPNKDYKEDLQKCITSIINKTTYTNYEIIIIENNSTSEEIFKYYEELSKQGNIQVVTWQEGFNYSKINNFGVKHATGDYYILLNNDIEIITTNWIEEMLMHCQRKDVGIVGAKLYYPDNTIQHAGVIIGIGGVAGHSHKYFEREQDGYFCRLRIIQNLSAVTAACFMVKREVYQKVNGLEETFTVAFNDVDFCLKVRELGKLIIFTPYVECYHYESKSRGTEDSPEKIQRFQGEINLFESRWGQCRRDPYYNENLTLSTENFGIRNNQ